MILLDTNVVIYYLQDNTNVVRILDQYRVKGESFCLSTVSVTELLSSPRMTVGEFFAIEHWLQSIHVIPVDLVIAKKAASLRREYRVTTTDGIIAATAMTMGATLLTNDRKLTKIPGINIVTPS